VLYALRYPLSFVVLVVAFVLGLWARGLAQRWVSGQRRPAWARKAVRRRSLMWLKPYVDPYGCVSAAIGGPGWGTPIDVSNFVRKPGGRVVAQLVVGPVVLCALGVAALSAFHQWSRFDLSGSGELLAAYRGDIFVAHPSHVHYTINFGQVALFLAGVEWLTMGILAIMPLPPLDGGKLLFALAPRTLGWQRAHYRLDEENWGALILLILALPIIVRTPLLVQFLGHIIDPLVGLIT
jgi:hypothetical protein